MYDKVRAHEYYMMHRKLKGHRAGVNSLTPKGKRRKRYTAPKGAMLRTKNGTGHAVKIDHRKIDPAGKEQIKAKIATLKANLGNLSQTDIKRLRRALKRKLGVKNG